MTDLFTALARIALRRAAAGGKEKLRAAAPELVWFLPPFSWAAGLTHPKRALLALLLWHSSRLSWALFRRLLRR